MSSSNLQSVRDLKHRVLTCLTKLSDRDTYPSAAAELESIAVSISLSSVPSFLSSISTTDPADKSPVRKLPLRLISLISQSHGDSLSPHLSKLLSAVTRRLRDPDSSVRLACAEAIASVSRHVTKPPLSLLIKPLLESLFTEQDPNAQSGSALCLSAAIENSLNPDPVQLTKLVPRFEKLLKCNSFKGKSALLGVFGSVIGVGPGLTRVGLENLVTCLMECLGSEDWAVRKAAAEVLAKVAVVEREGLPEFKGGCLKTIEAKRFDKVKIVREAMNQLVEAWKQIPDITLSSSSMEEANGGRYPPGPRNISSVTPSNKKSITSFTPTTGNKRTTLNSSDKRSSPAMFRKLDRKKPTEQKIKTSTPLTSVADVDTPKKKDFENDEKAPDRFAKLGARRALFNQKEYLEATEDIYRSQKECDELSLIYQQLGQIETQQANLLNLLQKFMGSSQTGLQALETRVHGLELTLDEISHDLTSFSKPNLDSEGASCCMLPSAEFLSPKLWRKTEPRHSITPFSSSKNANANSNRRLRMQARNELITNPLADLHNSAADIAEISTE